MRRLVVVQLLAVLGAVWLVSTPDARAQAPVVTVTPSSGSQSDTFVFEGAGFLPGTQLAVLYIAPSGRRYVLYLGDVEAVLVVGADGTFGVSITPATEFQGEGPGDWYVESCILGTTACWGGTIAIGP